MAMPKGKPPTLEQQLQLKNQEDVNACAKAIDAALEKHGCRIQYRRTEQVGADGVLRAIEERFVVKNPPVKPQKTG